jgi:hypothetical protein
VGLRERIEREVRAARRQAAAQGGQVKGGQVNVSHRVNKVVVRNVGGGSSAASAEQTAPIVQEPSRQESEDDG